ncbi:MAG: hypothetical protein SFV15_01960 [Polyangiaceae bacterium]|nr:hypothetical protein [Polyangiaceae bacterium]
MRKISLVSGCLVALFLAGCGAASQGANPLAPEERSGKKDRRGAMVSKAAAENFDGALSAFLAADKRGNWDAGTCEKVASSFHEANSEQEGATGKALPEALYNAGLAFQRCGQADKARGEFEAAIKADSAFHRARAQLALYRFQESGDTEQAVTELDQIIRDAKFQNVEGLVSLAALQMQRDSDRPDPDGKDDLERAQKNLQRALAIDDAYMPAFNQLALYYLEQAKAKAGAKDKQASSGRRGRRGMVVSGASRVAVNEQQLDLAALVAAQAQGKNPNYAPIHNTSGLILAELKNFNGAVKAFKRARDLDPGFFEAHMNYAAVNLSFRGFAEAEQAYRQALKLRPKEYEAHLGLALAIRGGINDSNYDQAVAEAQKELDEAKKLSPDRPETYYNEAILTQEYRSKRGDQATTMKMLQKAAQQYKEFIAKAGSEPGFQAAVKRSKERTQDIEDTLKFIKDGEEAARQQAEIEKAEAAQKKLEAEQKKAEEAAAAAAPKAPADAKPGETKPGDAKPGDKPGDAKPADASGAKGTAPADAKPGTTGGNAKAAPGSDKKSK